MKQLPRTGLCDAELGDDHMKIKQSLFLSWKLAYQLEDQSNGSRRLFNLEPVGVGESGEDD